MKIALISDIHANLPALEAVLADIGARSDIAATYHLGDLVGYGPWPGETVAAVRARGILGIQGNHDAVIGAAAAPQADAARHVRWTFRSTPAEARRHLSTLPTRLDLRPLGGHQAGPCVVLVHGTPAAIDDYWWRDRPDAFHAEMAALVGARPGDVVCSAHTHLPWYRQVDGVHLLNTGSVGRPKDGDPRAGYVILEISPRAAAVEFVRVEYDVDATASAIQRSPLPDHFAAFLRHGGTPDHP